MQRNMRFLTAALPLTPALVAASQSTPISKVLEMMNQMAEKGRSDMEQEKTRFTAFYQWCGDQTRVKGDEITKGTETMSALSAAIEEAAVEIQSLTSRIQELEEDITRWKKDQRSASDVRAKEKVDYSALSADYQESLTALDGAIATLKAQAANTPQADLLQVPQVNRALLQIQNSKLTPMASKSALLAFLQQPSVDAMPDERLLRGAPEANAYEFQSGGVVDMLEKLKDQFSSKKYELDVDEQNASHAYEQIMQQLTDNTENAEHEIAKKTAARGDTQQFKANSEADLAQTTAQRAEDQKYLDEMTRLCSSKKADFESRNKLRQDELAAIHQAIEIISSEAVAGHGETHLPALIQQRHASFAQVRGSADLQNPLQARIATFLAGRAKECNSHLLTMISERVAADPFTKVKKMIKDLIWKLMEEGTAETEHKGWCDTELGTNQQTRENKQASVNDLVNKEEDLTASIAQLTQEMESLTEAIAKLESDVAKATQDRADSKAANQQTVADAKESQVAVQNAIAVLKEFYAKSAQATALSQQGAAGPADDAPETFDAPYKGMLPEGGNVVDFLEVILTDFARLESETSAAEATENDEYKRYMHESNMDKSLKENSRGHKENKKADTESELQATQNELRSTQEQLDAANAYYEKLKPTCVDSGATYEDRVKRREAEMQSLKEALQILTGTDIDLS